MFLPFLISSLFVLSKSDKSLSYDFQYTMGIPSANLYFPTENDYKTSLNTLAEVYHFDPWIYEFDDLLWEEQSTGYVWKRRLYMLSSDDALLMIYPELMSQMKGGE